MTMQLRVESLKHVMIKSPRAQFLTLRLSILQLLPQLFVFVNESLGVFDGNVSERTGLGIPADCRACNFLQVTHSSAPPLAWQLRRFLG